MSKSLLHAVCASALVLGLAAFTVPSLAQNRATTNANGTTAIDRDTGHDRAQDRQTRTGINTNTNGKNATDRDTGRNRAQDRMSEQGADSSKAGGGTVDRDARGDSMSKGAPGKGRR
jgi:hypothetical protein